MFIALNTIPRKLIGAILAFPVAALAIYFYIIYTPELEILPKKSGQIEVKSFSDKNENGNSEIYLDSNPDAIAYKYMLKKGIVTPFASVRIEKLDKGYFDLHRYNRVKITIKAEKGVRLPFIMSSFIPGYTQENDEKSFLYLAHNLNVSPDYSTIEIPMTELKTPNWWYISKKKTESEVVNADFSKIRYLYLGNCINLGSDVQDIVSVTKIIFDLDLGVYFGNSILFLILYFGILGIIAYAIHLRQYRSEVGIGYFKVNTENHADKAMEIIISYLTSEFHNPELDSTAIQLGTGIHERKVSALIKNSTGMQVKQYINFLRMEEAKKLLVTTDLTMMDIAFKIGYSNVTHFNRVFKSFYKISPSDFRKGHADSLQKE